MSSHKLRSSRAATNNTCAADVPNLQCSELDCDGRLVYVDLQPRTSRDAALALGTLRQKLAADRPTSLTLHRLVPINRGRILVEIDSPDTFELFGSWLRSATAEYPPLQQMLSSLGPHLRVIGAQWIVPKVTEYERRVLPQTPHTDVGCRGEVVSVAIHVDKCEMGTLIDPKATISSKGVVQYGVGFGRAATSIFAYDTGVVHCGPGGSRVDGPFPKYFTSRVFFLLCSSDLDEDKVARHRHDNGLLRAASMASDVVLHMA